MAQTNIMKHLVNKTPDVKTEMFVNLSKKFEVSNRDGGGYFIGKAKDKILGGLSKKMKRTFYPEREDTNRKRGSSSLQGGERVHRQIYHMIHCKKLASCDCKVKTNESRLNQLTINAFKKMKEIEFTPIDAEVPLLSLKSNFCTRVDVVGYLWKGTERQTSCFIELKTGYSQQWKRDGKKSYFLAPLNEVYASSRNINQLQTACCHSVLSEEHKINFPSCFVLYLKKEYSECSVENPADWWWKDKKKTIEIFDKLCK